VVGRTGFGDAPLLLFGQRGVCRVVERAQHPGHVAKWRSLDEAFAQRTRRLAFEIEYDEITTGEQDLAEMEIAVAADPHACRSPTEHAVEPLEHHVFALEDHLSFRAQLG
jgi:hypothetical protein